LVFEYLHIERKVFVYRAAYLKSSGIVPKAAIVFAGAAAPLLTNAKGWQIININVCLLGIEFQK